jgi:hypothetical protein
MKFFCNMYENQKKILTFAELKPKILTKVTKLYI